MLFSVPKDTHFFSLCKFPGIGKFTETEGKMMVTKSWWWGGWEEVVPYWEAYRVSVWVDKKVLENSGDGCSVL